MYTSGYLHVLARKRERMRWSGKREGVVNEGMKGKREGGSGRRRGRRKRWRELGKEGGRGENGGREGGRKEQTTPEYGWMALHFS